MATYHQLKRPARLYHETEWTVVSDPPNDVRALSTFSTEQRAREYEASLISFHPELQGHTYVLKPGGGVALGLLAQQPHRRTA